MMRHILPNAMTAALTYLPFILRGSVTTLTSLDFLATACRRLAVARRAGAAGQEQPQRAVARLHRFFTIAA
jgi:ABC-type microcin C transport system permease subunit YejE